VHETSIHVPMFVWGAGVPVADVHGLRSLVDVKPTMLELLGLPRHPRPYLSSLLYFSSSCVDVAGIDVPVVGMRQRGRPLFESAATTGGADADSDRMRTVARAHASVYMHTFFGGHVAAVRRGELKLIVHEFRDAQLFNISADPREDVDISGFADPLLLADMHEELRRYRPNLALPRA
jgi:arylsulfatase A-like enzyme